MFKISGFGDHNLGTIAFLSSNTQNPACPAHAIALKPYSPTLYRGGPLSIRNPNSDMRNPHGVYLPESRGGQNEFTESLHDLSHYPDPGSARLAAVQQRQLAWRYPGSNKGYSSERCRGGA